MSNQDKLYEARDIIYETLRAVRVGPDAVDWTSGSWDSRAPDPRLSEVWCLDRARNAAQALMLLLCPEPTRGPVPTDEEYADETRIK